jgi:hypothetical protein
MRTALSQFSFALVVLKIFTSEFYPIGALLACYGACVLLVAVYRRYEGNRMFFDREEETTVREPIAAESADSPQISGRDLDPGDGMGAVTTGAETPAAAGRPALQNRGAAGERNNSVSYRRRQVVVVKKKFRTSGNSVALLVGLSLISYIALVVLVWMLSE